MYCRFSSLVIKASQTKSACGHGEGVLTPLHHIFNWGGSTPMDNLLRGGTCRDDFCACTAWHAPIPRPWVKFVLKSNALSCLSSNWACPNKWETYGVRFVRLQNTTFQFFSLLSQVIFCYTDSWFVLPSHCLSYRAIVCYTESSFVIPSHCLLCRVVACYTELLFVITSHSLLYRVIVCLLYQVIVCYTESCSFISHHNWFKLCKQVHTIWSNV